MSTKSSISLSVIRRLPRYYRFLGELKRAGCTRISSKELSEKMGVTASQIRQDLNCFGGFGQQGYGYHVVSLYDEIAKILGIETQIDAILIGVGNIGKALASRINFAERGFRLVGLFDTNPEILGQTVADLPVQSMEALDAFCAEHHPEMAIICTPKNAAEAVGEHLIQCGIRSFWNFSHYDLSIKYEDAIVENVHLNDSLMTLGYRMKEASRTEQKKTAKKS